MGGAARTPVRSALVEDHDATRAELVATLSEHPARLELVAAFRDAESLLRSPLLESLDVALVDLGLPGMNGVELIHRLAATAPRLRAIAFTAFADEATVLDALSSGAFGYLVKDEPVERIIRAVEEARAGEHPISSRVIGFLLAQARRAPPPASLTSREEELARALAEGLSYTECASRMRIALGTVQTHVKSLYRKLAVTSRGEVRDWVRRHCAAR